MESLAILVHYTTSPSNSSDLNVVDDFQDFVDIVDYTISYEHWTLVHRCRKRYLRFYIFHKNVLTFLFIFYFKGN